MHSGQTLGDIWDTLPCDHRTLPETAPSGSDEVTLYKVPTDPINGAAICVEEVVYGDGLSAPDYGR